MVFSSDSPFTKPCVRICVSLCSISLDSEAHVSSTRTCWVSVAFSSGLTLAIAFWSLGNEAKLIISHYMSTCISHFTYGYTLFLKHVGYQINYLLCLV